MPFENQYITEQSIQNDSQKKGYRLTIILIISILLAGVYLAYYIYNGSKSNSSDTDELLEPISQESAIEESNVSSQMQDSSISSALDSEIDNKSEQSYTMAQVAENNNKNSCWTIINGSVYNITSYIPTHPGGESEILQICGKDGTILFSKPSEHASGGAGNVLENFKLGTISP